MLRYRAVVAGVAIVMAAPAVAGCSPGVTTAPGPTAPSTSSISVSAAAPRAGQLPVAEALADVLYRLADPAVPGTEKLRLIDGVNADDAGALDKFTTALNDNGYRPLTFDVTNIAWSDRHPGDVVADVNVTTRGPDTGRFALPMEFKPHDGGWQLSHQTADMLLTLGNPSTGTPSPNATPAR